VAKLTKAQRSAAAKKGWRRRRELEHRARRGRYLGLSGFNPRKNHFRVGWNKSPYEPHVWLLVNYMGDVEGEIEKVAGGYRAIVPGIGSSMHRTLPAAEKVVEQRVS